MRINRSTLLSTITLGESDQVPNEIQILRVGKFNHPTYGKFEITSKVLAEMKKNFDDNIRGIDTALDYFHDSEKDASGWVEALELKEGGQELWAKVKWTPLATRKLSDRELRYFSPDFAFVWEDPEKLTKHNNVLFGGGLTNRPFVKEMKAIVADEKQGEKSMTELEKAQAEVKTLEAKNLKLSEDMAAKEKQMADMAPKASVQELEAKIAELQAQLAKAKSENEVALADKKKAEDAKLLAEKESKFNVLLSEGKLCAAQKEAYLANDMEKLFSLAEKVNLKAQGSSQTETVVDDDTKAVLKLAEEKRKADAKLSVGDSISLAKKELKK